jgi:FdhD protein
MQKVKNNSEQNDNVGVKRVQIFSFDGKDLNAREDIMVVEDPLEIIIRKQNEGEIIKFTLSITMRTPGDDFNLVRGFLFTEGIIHKKEDIQKIRYVPTKSNLQIRSSSVEVFLADDCPLDKEAMSRHFYTTSSCGVCGKTAIDQLRTHFSFIPKKGQPKLSPEMILSAKNKLFSEQDQFQKTGGIHAAAILDKNGDVICLKEDVGRHNAFDKLIGCMLEEGKIPLDDHIVMVSGRASFELVQKALSAGIPLFLAIGAPSSLAVELADEYGLSLIGFIKENQFNVYSYPERIAT